MRKLAIGIVVVLVFATVAVRGYMVWNRTRTVLPDYVEMPAGPRAPSTDFLGLAIGKDTLPAVEVAYRRQGVTCVNTSMRALMQAKRDETKQKMAEAEKRGEDPDGVTGASLANYVSKKERNPQVRLSCTKVDAGGFTDRKRSPGAGLWLIIFDSEESPLRHTSFQRGLSDATVALAEWNAAVDSITTRFGAPTRLEAPRADDPEPIKGGAYFVAEWAFADLKIDVTLFRIGGRITLQERAEVPWPVRPDAPALPR
jgi:hypothetical protein